MQTDSAWCMEEAWQARPINSGGGDGEVIFWARSLKAHPVFWTLWSILNQALPLLHFHETDTVHRHNWVLGSVDQSLTSSRKQLFCDHTSHAQELESYEKVFSKIFSALSEVKNKVKVTWEKHLSLRWHSSMPLAHECVCMKLYPCILNPLPFPPLTLPLIS